MKGDFMWAVTQMKQGKKVKKLSGTAIHYIDNNDVILWDMGAVVEKSKSMKVEDFEATDWEIYEEKVIKGANIEPNKDMTFYCRTCDVASIDVKKQKDGFYVCKHCGSFASVVEKDEYEKEDSKDEESSASSKAESNWNLADEICLQESHHTEYWLRKDIKTFIQKVKEDIEIKFTFDDGRRMFEIIDKRAGGL